MRLFYPLIALYLILCSAPLLASVIPLTDSECQDMRDHHIISEEAPVSCDRLSRVTFLHVDFQQKTQQGEFIVLDAVAPYVDDIMATLYEKRFPIHQAKPMQAFQGNDNASMKANNSSAFNYRKIAGNDSISLHAYGVALDINPLQNPFITFTDTGTANINPAKGAQYLNRKQYRLGKLPAQGFAEQIVDIFALNGFRTWGGDWNTPIDFQHFQTSREMAVLMAQLNTSNASLFFKNYVNWYQQCALLSQSVQQTLAIDDYTIFLKQELSQRGLTSTPLNKAYRLAPDSFIRLLEQPASVTLTRCFSHVE